MGYAQKAVGLFEKAIRLDPVHAQKTYLRLARAYIYLGNYKEAIDIYETSPRMSPIISVPGWNWLSVMLH